MEIFFDIIFLALLLSSTVLNFVIYKKFIQNRKAVSDFHENLVNAIDRNTEHVNHTSNKIDAFGNGLDRSMLALRELLDATKPIKPNNWDSIKEAFKGPTRIEVNERN